MLKVHIVDRLHLGTLQDDGRSACLLAADILDIDIVYGREVVVIQPLAGIHRG